MSVTWRPAPPDQHLCRRRSCVLADYAGVIALAAAGASMVPLLLIPSIAWCAVTGGLLAVTFTSLFWSCPHSSHPKDLEALIIATREPRPPVQRERAAQRFTGHRKHFDEWEEELQK